MNGPRPSELVKSLEALAGLDEDDLGTRFSKPPPSCISGTSTEYEDTTERPAHEEEQNRETTELGNSSVSSQFSLQTSDEEARILAARDEGLLDYPRGFKKKEAAQANVRLRWIEQGIWDQRWGEVVAGRTWKHENTLDFLPSNPVDVRSNAVAGIQSHPPGEANGSDGTGKDRQLADQEAAQVHKRDTSRPCYQFVYQYCKEREWIRMGLINNVNHPDLSECAQDHDLDAMAYQNVRGRWIREGVWDVGWSYLPGLSWRHEKPRKFPFPGEDSQKWEAAKASAMKTVDGPINGSYPIAPHEGYPPQPEQFITPPPDCGLLNQAYSCIHGPGLFGSETQVGQTAPPQVSKPSQDPKEHMLDQDPKEQGMKKPGNQRRKRRRDENVGPDSNPDIKSQDAVGGNERRHEAKDDVPTGGPGAYPEKKKTPRDKQRLAKDTAVSPNSRKLRPRHQSSTQKALG